MSRLWCVALLLSIPAMCADPLPGYYKRIDRVTWVVGNIDRVRPAWEKLGLSNIREYTNIQLTGEFRGEPVTIYAWQITGQLGNLTVDMIQPAEGQLNAYTDFLGKHGDGILSIVHEVPNQRAMDSEITRMKGKGVAVLQQVNAPRGDGRATCTYFDTGTEGKFALGLMIGPGERKAAGSTVPQLSPPVRDGAAVSAYWAKLGLPPLSMSRAGVRVGARYRGGPIALAVEVKDLRQSIGAYEKLGYHVRQPETQGDTQMQYAYMDTDSTGGVGVELVGRR